MSEKSTTAKSKPNLRLPRGMSPSEEAQWWDEHPDYWSSAEGDDELVGPMQVRRTKAINLRLPVDTLEAIKHEAARRALPYQTLICMWLNERVDAEAKSDPAS